MLADVPLPIVNIAGYKFVDLEEPATLRGHLQQVAQRLALKGTILLAHEGINFYLAGTAEQTAAFLTELAPFVGDVAVKRSASAFVPFEHLTVKVKAEIIRMNVPAIAPAHGEAPRISTQLLRQWFDDGKDFAILDTRNQFEVEHGTFEGAISLQLRSFGDFPHAMTNVPEELKSRPLVTFCTGGIRCEKAALLLQAAGFQQVYQLDGGILAYFEQCGGAHWQGECFVFDQRISVDPTLRASVEVE